MGPSCLSLLKGDRCTPLSPACSWPLWVTVVWITALGKCPVRNKAVFGGDRLGVLGLTVLQTKRLEAQRMAFPQFRPELEIS